MALIFQDGFDSFDEKTILPSKLKRDFKKSEPSIFYQIRGLEQYKAWLQAALQQEIHITDGYEFIAEFRVGVRKVRK